MFALIYYLLLFLKFGLLKMEYYTSFLNPPIFIHLTFLLILKLDLNFEDFH